MKPESSPLDVTKLAAQILNNRNLREFLLACRASDRRLLYDALVPVLNFKAKPYFLLMS